MLTYTTEAAELAAHDHDGSGPGGRADDSVPAPVPAPAPRTLAGYRRRETRAVMARIRRI